MIGNLKIITGCMGAGKTFELARRISVAKIAEKNVALYKPIMGYKDGKFDSRCGIQIDVNPISTRLSKYEYLQEFTKANGIIVIDEAQFFDPDDFVWAIKKALLSGTSFIISGLVRDYQDEPFGAMPYLLTIADEIIQLFAVCNKCKRQNATKTIKKKLCGNQSPLDQSIYEARCSDCIEMIYDNQEEERNKILM